MDADFILLSVWVFLATPGPSGHVHRFISYFLAWKTHWPRAACLQTISIQDLNPRCVKKNSLQLSRLLSPSTEELSYYTMTWKAI